MKLPFDIYISALKLEKKNKAFHNNKNQKLCT